MATSATTKKPEWNLWFEIATRGVPLIGCVLLSYYASRSTLEIAQHDNASHIRRIEDRHERDKGHVSRTIAEIKTKAEKTHDAVLVLDRMLHRHIVTPTHDGSVKKFDDIIKRLREFEKWKRSR
jgi:hypothetical protein